jgi:hypothetical protein
MATISGVPLQEQLIKCFIIFGLNTPGKIMGIETFVLNLNNCIAFRKQGSKTAGSIVYVLNSSS